MQPKLFVVLILIYTLLIIDFTQCAGQIPGVSVPTVPRPNGANTPLQLLVSKSFQNWRTVMLKGDASNGIPILDPLVIPFSIPITIPSPFFGIGNYQLILSKLTLAGLSTFTLKNLNVDSSTMSFENYIGNMSASCEYVLNYIFVAPFPPFLVNQGSATGAIYGADLIGSGTLFPTPDNWFKLLTVAMTFSFASLDIRIYPKFAMVDSKMQKQIQDSIYNQIQAMKPNMSELTRTTYSKTVELRLPVGSS